MKKDIKLCLSGSGTPFYYHFGAYIRLYESFNITDLVGVSGGFILASLIALYKEPRIIKKNLDNFNLSDVKDFNFNIFDYNSILLGNKILELFKKYFNYQFKDIRFNLSGIATKIDDLSEVVFNHRNTPDIFLYDSLRASMSIACVFQPHIINNEKYFDGGYVNNCPHDFWGNNENVYTVKISDNKKYTVNNILDASIVSQFASIKANELKHKQDNPKGHYIEIINEFDFLRFDFTTKEKNKMIKDGYKAVDNYLKKEK